MINQKNKLIIVIVILSLVPFVSADQIGIGQGSNWVDIIDWEEVIHIKNNDLIVNLALNAIVRGPNRYQDTFNFYIMPERVTEKFPTGAEIKGFNVCLGRKGGHSYEGIPLECEGILSFDEKPKEKSYDKWEYVINVSEIIKDEWIAINLSYIVPNFVKEKGSVKTIRFTSDCYPMGQEPEHCPSRKQVIKHIMLPPGTIPQFIPSSWVLQPRSNGGYRITISDFTPEEGSTDQYTNVIFSYIDQNQIEEEKNRDLNRNIWVAIGTGLLTGILSSLIVNYLLSRNKKKWPIDKIKYNALCNSCGSAWNKKNNIKKCYKCGSRDVVDLK